MRILKACNILAKTKIIDVESLLVCKNIVKKIFNVTSNRTMEEREIPK